jgi:hypothetical protein
MPSPDISLSSLVAEFRMNAGECDIEFAKRVAQACAVIPDHATPDCADCPPGVAIRVMFELD